MTNINKEKLYLDSLNEEQMNIVLDSKFLNQQSNTCIIACAGSGKTKTLISKIAYMINDLNCDPKHFFITTFTKNASSEIKERLISFLSEDIIKNMTIGTFHSIAYNVFNDIDNLGIDDNIELYLYKFYEHLNNNEMNYKYIFIDEYQDINEIQEKIIRKLSEKSKLLIVVGDDQQNIYTFRNTDIKYILTFTKNYLNSEYKYLVKNYRCNKCIVQLANIILSYNKNKIDKTIIPMNKNKPKPINLISFINQKTQNMSLINMLIQVYNNKSKDLHKIAIIARNNKILKNLEYNLALNNIPSYYIETNQNAILTNQNIQSIKERIILSTIHGTKGLEFDEVYAIDINDGVFPSTFSNDIEEERRLFYVQITRAKNKLTICYDCHRPSIFIKEILEYPNVLNILNIKSDFNGEPLIFEQKPITNVIKDYSVENIITTLDHNDYDDFINNIFNYRTELFQIKNLHKPMPEYFSKFYEKRNFLITNISSLFCDFIETYINRSIQHITNKQIENIDYVIYALYVYKEGIEQIRKRKDNDIVDEKFKTSLKTKTDEELSDIIKYYKSGIKISSYISDDFLPFFTKAYENYKSDKSSNLIIFDIFIISLVRGIIKGRNSILHLINFTNEYNKNKINKSDIYDYSSWLKKVESTLKLYFKNVSSIKMSNTLFDEKTNIKSVIDIMYNDSLIKIKPNNNKPHVSSLIEVLSNLSLARVNNLDINKCEIYNPITGNIYRWNLTKWKNEKDLIYFLTERFN